MSNVKFKFAGVHFDENANYGIGEHKARFVRFDENHPDAEATLNAFRSKTALAFTKARDGVVNWSLKQVEENIAKIEKDPKHSETPGELSRAKAPLVAETKGKPSAAFGKTTKPVGQKPKPKVAAAVL